MGIVIPFSLKRVLLSENPPALEPYGLLGNINKEKFYFFFSVFFIQILHGVAPSCKVYTT